MNDLDLHIRTFFPHHIDTVVNLGIDDAWHFIGFYGAPEIANQGDSWIFICHLANQLNMLWVCLGDFNEIACLSKKWGGSIRDKRQMQSFRGVPGFLWPQGILASHV